MLIKIILAMLAFAANSVLCRLALADQQIDPMSFSLIRIASGALILIVLWRCQKMRTQIEWNIYNAVFLAIYVLAFSYAYINIDAGIGALILFGTVQLSMVIYGLFHGEHLSLRRISGLIVALIGMVVLLLPGASAPSLWYALMIAISGLAWAAYSIVGKNMRNPLSSTLANFTLAFPVVLICALIFQPELYLNIKGITLAVISGGLTSSVAYVLWYSIVKRIDRITASTVQLSVPCLAILGGSIFIGEALSGRVIFSTVIVLFGIILVIFSHQPPSKTQNALMK